MLEINLFRVEKGGNPHLIRKSQRRRFANAELVDEVINLDKEWRQLQFELENLRKEFNKINKQIAQLRIAGEDTTEMIKITEDNKKSATEKEAEVRDVLKQLNSKLEIIGNLAHDSVPISNDEANNEVIRSWGEKRLDTQLKNHFELVELLGIVDLKKGVDVAGGRGFYLKGDGVHLNQALIIFGLDFLEKRGYTALQTPFFLRKDIMAKCAQLSQFDEELYKLNIPYQVVAVVSGALNDAASKKYDLEGWFPASQTYRELVSCSNCTDYQSRRLEIRFGQKKNTEQSKKYVHLLNSTLTATERIMCCIIENYQREDGVEIPEALQEYMGGKTFLPFKNKLADEAKGKKVQA